MTDQYIFIEKCYPNVLHHIVNISCWLQRSKVGNFMIILFIVDKYTTLFFVMYLSQYTEGKLGKL